MRSLDLELHDSDGDPLYVRVFADGKIQFEWERSVLGIRDKRPFDETDWLASAWRRPCVPIIKAAFAALREGTDDR